jgi:hypothetical protein
MAEKKPIKFEFKFWIEKCSETSNKLLWDLDKTNFTLFWIKINRVRSSISLVVSGCFDALQLLKLDKDGLYNGITI